MFKRKSAPCSRYFKATAPCPVQQRAHEDKDGREAEALLDDGEETNLLAGRGIIAHQVVAALTQLPGQGELPGLEIFDATPGQVRGLRTGGPAEVAFVDQGDINPLGCQRCRRDSYLQSSGS